LCTTPNHIIFDRLTYNPLRFIRRNDTDEQKATFGASGESQQVRRPVRRGRRRPAVGFALAQRQSHGQRVPRAQLLLELDRDEVGHLGNEGEPPGDLPAEGASRRRDIVSGVALGRGGLLGRVRIAFAGAGGAGHAVVGARVRGSGAGGAAAFHCHGFKGPVFPHP